MSTRAAIIIRDSHTTLNFYRHSDGYPSHCGADLTEFVKDYASGAMRDNVSQSAGWLIVRGHFEYKKAEPKNFPNPQPDRTGPRPDARDQYMGWKVGAYEPTSDIHGDEAYLYVIDLEKRTLTCFTLSNSGETRTPCREFETVRF